MKLLRITPATLLAVAVFGLLIGASYRSDASADQNTTTLVQLTLPPIVEHIKALSLISVIVPPLCLLYVLRLRPRIKSPLGRLTAIMGLLALVLILRLAPGALIVSSKVFAASVMFSLVFILAMCVSGLAGYAGVIRGLYNGLLAFALFHSALNALLGVSGYGFFGSRFVGMTAHPNFLGVQMACCVLISLGAFSGRLRSNKLASVLLVTSGIVLVLTGSRTALLVLGIGLLTFFALRGVRTWQLLLLAFSAVALTVYSAAETSSNVSLTQYDRGNTRAGAWEAMWTNVVEAPLIGHGVLPESSENSFLRGWSAIGLIYIAAYGAFIAMAVQAAVLLARRRMPRVVLAFAALLFGLLAGAIAEGYLLDTFSFPIFAFLLAGLALDSAVLNALTKDRAMLGGTQARLVRNVVRRSRISAP